jgi:uncharacterized protein (TIGR02421 family)
MIKKETIKRITDRLSDGRIVNELLPEEGLIHIDKLLPYICVYRFRNKEDLYFSRFLKTQASYIIAADTLELTSLLQGLARVISSSLNAFLVLELWPVEEDHGATFQILCPKGKSPATVAALEEGIEKMKATYPAINSLTMACATRHPPGLAPLLTTQESKNAGTLIIGIGVPVIYKSKDKNEVYTFLHRKLIRRFSVMIKKAVYEFIRVQTSNPFQHYLMLGKTNLDEISMQVDRELADICEGMSFLLRVTPVNSNTEWLRFRDSGFEKCPSFNYRLITLDPEQIKRKLYDIPIELVEDPTLSFIFREKRLEIEKQLTMLEERGTENFRFIGESLYGKLKSSVVDTAGEILTVFQSDLTGNGQECMNCVQFARKARGEISHYQQHFPNVTFQLEIREDISGIMVSNEKLLIGRDLSIDRRRCDALLQHEIGTHMLTYGNGKKQPLRQMYAGLAGYDQLQEGLAVLSEYLVGGLTTNRMRLLAGRVKAAEALIRGADFVETFRQLKFEFGFRGRVAFYITMRIFRGGGLTKDAMYLTGLINVLEYLRKGGSLETLYTGKFNTTHVALIEELLHRSVLLPPVTPNFLNREEVHNRLKTIGDIGKITEMVSF